MPSSAIIPTVSWISLKTDAVIALRIATAADCAALTEIALAAKAFWQYSDADMQRFAPALTVTESLINDWESGVLEEADDIAGFYLLDCRAAEAELMLLYVAPLAMGKGYGRALFRAAAASARRQRYAHLDIAIDPHAEGFYQRMGARQVGWCRALWNSAEELPRYRLKL